MYKSNDTEILIIEKLNSPYSRKVNLIKFLLFEHHKPHLCANRVLDRLRGIWYDRGSKTTPQRPYSAKVPFIKIKLPSWSTSSSYLHGVSRDRIAQRLNYQNYQVSSDSDQELLRQLWLACGFRACNITREGTRNRNVFNWFPIYIAFLINTEW